MAGYPKSGNLIPKALLRTFEPVAAAISSRAGLLETSPLTELSEPLRFNPFWTLLEIVITLIAFYGRVQVIFKEIILYVGFGYGLSRTINGSFPLYPVRNNEPLEFLTGFTRQLGWPEALMVDFPP